MVARADLHLLIRRHATVAHCRLSDAINVSDAVIDRRERVEPHACDALCATFIGVIAISINVEDAMQTCVTRAFGGKGAAG